MENLYTVYGVSKHQRLRSRVISAKNEVAAAQKFSSKYKGSKVIHVEILPMFGMLEEDYEPKNPKKL